MDWKHEQTNAFLEEAIIATSADAIIVTDDQGVIRLWNLGAVRIFGFREEEAIDTSLDLIIPERLRTRHWEGYEHVMASGRTQYGTGALLSVPAVTKDGREISVEFTIILLHDPEGRIVGTAAILRDVTARFQEMRELKRRLAEQVRSGRLRDATR